MKNLFAYSFIVLYLVALCRPIAPLIEYYARQDYFAKVLCINKDKPEILCNGKCILIEKLKVANDTTNASLPPKIDLKEYPIGFVTAFSHTVVHRLIFSATLSVYNVFSLYNCYLQKLFKPPCA